MVGLESGEIGIEMGDGLDAAEIVFERDVLVRGVRVFVRKAEANQDAGHFEGVIHLRHERNGTTLANEHRFFAKSFFQSRLGLLENGIVIGSDPGFSSAQNFELAMDGFRKKLSNMLLHEFGDFLRVLIGYETRGEFCKGL